MGIAALVYHADTDALYFTIQAMQLQDHTQLAYVNLVRYDIHHQRFTLLHSFHEIAGQQLYYVWDGEEQRVIRP